MIKFGIVKITQVEWNFFKYQYKEHEKQKESTHKWTAGSFCSPYPLSPALENWAVLLTFSYSIFDIARVNSEEKQKYSNPDI